MRRAIPRLIFAAALVLAVPGTAAAQKSPRTHSWLFGISFGGGQRTTSAPLKPAQLPADATQVPSPLTVGVIDIEGGITLRGRLAVLSLFERRVAMGHSPTGWGNTAGHAALRWWLARRAWVEGGVGFSELVYVSSGIPDVKTTWWSPAYEASGGYEIFKRPTVALQVLARYTTATFEGRRLQTVSMEIGLLGRR